MHNPLKDLKRQLEAFSYNFIAQRIAISFLIGITFVLLPDTHDDTGVGKALVAIIVCPFLGFNAYDLWMLYVPEESREDVQVVARNSRFAALIAVIVTALMVIIRLRVY